MPPLRRLWLAALAVAMVLGLVAAMVAGRPNLADGLVDAPAGAGDPYLPDDGGGGYDVSHYAIDITWNPGDRTLVGVTTVTLVAEAAFDVFHLDLQLPVTSVALGTTPLPWAQLGDDLQITLPRAEADTPARRPGESASVTITYTGSPEDVPQNPREPATYRIGNEVLIAGEPHAASWWYPANDIPGDPATFDVTVHVPTGVEAVAAGRLDTHGPDPDHAGSDVWRWSVNQPTVTYATFLAIGQYEISSGTVDGRPYVYAVSSLLTADEQRAAMNWLRRTPERIRALEAWLGPYPLDTMGGLVPGVSFFWAGLECAARPIYNSRYVGDIELLDHELAHEWAGDTVTLAEWNDVYLNEALASYTSWLTAGRATPAEQFGWIYSKDEAEFWAPPLSDPGRDAMFERVYDRGPASLHALRTRMGDEAFRAFLTSWSQQRGPRTLEEFRRQADDATPEDLTGFFTAWLDGTTRPAATAENGVPTR